MSSMTSSDVYEDVQYPRIPIVLGALSIAGAAVAVGAVFGPGAALGTAIAGTALLSITAYRARLHILVSREELRVGPAHIAWSWIERVEVLEGERMRVALTTDAHPLDHIDIRRSAAGLRVWLADPGDPHRCWVTSISDPERLRGVLHRLEGIVHVA